MLISVVILFLVCQVPVACNLIYTSIASLQPDTNEIIIITALNNILNLLVAFNAAGNFFLYCCLSKKYRKTLVNLFCPCFKQKTLRKNNTQQTTIYSTLTTNQYHSTAATTGFQIEKSPNRQNTSNDLKSNDHQINSGNKVNNKKNKQTQEEIVMKHEELGKQTDVDDVKLSIND